MEVAACAVGRIGSDGPWVGFAPGLDDDYLFVVGTPDGSRSIDADAEDLLALACAYFEETIDEPPEELAATHGDIAALVRHVAEQWAVDTERRRLLGEAVDSIDDGLAADVVVGRLSRCLDGEDPVERLRRRAAALGASG